MGGTWGGQGCPRPPDVAWCFDSPQIVESWHDALSSMSDYDHVELEAHVDHVQPTPPSGPVPVSSMSLPS